MVEGQFGGGAAILAGKAVAKEDVEAGEGRLAVLIDIVLQRDDAGQDHFHRRAADDLVIGRYDINAVLIDRLDRFLPRPDRERIVGERTKVGVQHQRGPAGRRAALDLHQALAVQERIIDATGLKTRLLPWLSAKPSRDSTA
jgi:hypothetical protein